MNNSSPKGQFSGKQGLEGSLKRVNAKMVYAGMDPKTRLETHLGDLLDLETTEAETQAAVDWLLSRKTGLNFRRKLKDVLDRIGHEKLAERLQG